MKYKILIVSFLLISFGAVGQARLGLKGAANLSTFVQNFEDQSDEFATNLRLGVNVGAVVDLPLSDLLSLRTGVEYSSKGTAIDLEEEYGSPVDGYERYVLNYLVVPADVAVDLGMIKVTGGAYFGFGISGEYTYDLQLVDGQVTFNETGSEPIDFKGGKEIDVNNDNEQLSQYDYGLRVGLEFDINDRFATRFDYSRGLSNLLLNDPDDLSFNREDNSAVNSTLSFGLIVFLTQ